MKKLLFLTACVLLLLGATAAPAGAIIGGTQDVGNTYYDVGLVVQMGAFVPGQWGFSGSCTLVCNHPGNVVVLCSAHQLYGWSAADNRVTFEATPDFGWMWTDSENVGLGGVETYQVIRQELFPGFVPTALASKRKQMGPGQDDLALIWLEKQVMMPGTESPMPTRPIVGLRGLDSVDLTGETFTAVGYGLTDWVYGSVNSLFAGGRSLGAWDGRNSRAVSVITDQGLIADRYLHLSFGQSPNDSGSPLLLDGAIVAVTSGGPPGNGSGSYDYRLDTQAAQDFLHANGIPTGQ